MNVTARIGWTTVRGAAWVRQGLAAALAAVSGVGVLCAQEGTAVSPAVEAVTPVVAPLENELVPAPLVTTATASAAAVAAAPELTSASSLTVLPGADGMARVTLELNDEEIGNAIKLFTRIAGVSIISATNMTQRVSATITDKPWQPAIQTLLAQCNLQLSERPVASGIYVIETAQSDIVLLSETIHLNHAKVEDVTALVKAMLAGRGTVTSFPSGNAIVVNAAERDIAEALKVIKLIDLPRKQVFIEARFVEMTASASHKLGLDWSSLDGWGVTLQNPTASFLKTWQSEMLGRDPAIDATKAVVPGASGTAGATTSSDVSKWLSQQEQVRQAQTQPWTAPANATETVMGFTKTEQQYETYSAGKAQISASDFSLVLRALEGTEGVSVVSNPKIIVANEEQAVVDMTTKEPYVEVSIKRGTVDSPGDEVSTKLATIPGRSEPFVGEAFFSYGITLQVTPRVNNASNITVTIEPSISERVDTLKTPGATIYPIIRMKKVNTVFTLDDGKTAVIGGLTRTEERDTEKGVPYLRNIPLIGKWLFNSSVREKVQTEILIFVTVGIVESNTDDQKVGLPRNAVLYDREPIPSRPTVKEVRNLEKSHDAAAKKAQDAKLRGLERVEVIESMGDEPAPVEPVQ